MPIKEGRKNMTYNNFLETKSLKVNPCGIDAKNLPDCLFDYQKADVKWALKKGRAAVFAGNAIVRGVRDCADAHDGVYQL